MDGATTLGEIMTTTPQALPEPWERFIRQIWDGCQKMPPQPSALTPERVSDAALRRIVNRHAKGTPDRHPKGTPFITDYARPMMFLCSADRGCFFVPA